MLLRFLFISFVCCISTLAFAQTGHNVINQLALEADSINLLARKYLAKNKKDSSLLFLEKAMQLARASGNNAIIARCNVDMASYYFLQGKYQLAKKYSDEGWPYAELTDLYEVKITSITQRANVYNVLDKKDSSVFYYRYAEKYNSEKNPYRNWLVYMALGELFNQTDDEAEAIKYFRKSYDITSQKVNIIDHSYLLTVFINFYMAHNKPEGAGKLVAEYNNVMEERKRKKIDDPMQNLLMNLTSSKLEDNVAFMKAIKQNSLAGGQILEALVANGYIISYHMKRKNYDEALKYAGEGEELAKGTGGLQDVYGAAKMKYAVLQKAGRYNEANVAAETLFALKDSLLTIQKREQVYELETKFETERKENQINLLTTNNKLNEKEIALLIADKKVSSLLLQQEILQKRSLTIENTLMDSIVRSEQAYSLAANNEKEKQAALNAALDRENSLKANQLVKERRTKWLLAGGAGLLLLSGISILLLYRKQKNKNAIIQKQATDLEVLMKEIHHRVKNNLQVVSSLLDLQSHSITDEQAHEAVKEGRNRVQSMALIHQNLYSEGNIKGIRLNEYVSNLLQTLCDSYNISNDKIKINASIDDLNLDVDTMIPLGLVLNELVSNSFKYAFKEKQNGQLNILLRERENELHLIVSDNGSGFPEELDVKSGKSFGLKMIRAFAQKLKAKLDIYNNNGAVVEMKITKYKTA